ncbi:ABC transporter permease [Lactonifactor longoviformis]|uniref:hypothetical protein n=1 Tax=Lactonifactor longoviformis TaxID=341220 RepID=UPI001D02F3D6|nr:hypothetical protein [Lactonifactor longoviformis]MCB5711502.1 hypothetical protein [Lactonifactor longoviformis]MCB5715469.1 hypothetical protein [Lactonifactor longoviformis]
MRLLLKECRKLSKSILFWGFVLILIINWKTQFQGVTRQEIGSSSREGSFLHQPREGESYYGEKPADLETDKKAQEKVMAGAVQTMVREYESNLYACYPLGYYKEKSLGSGEQEKVAGYIREITGCTPEEVENMPPGYFPANPVYAEIPASGGDGDSSYTIREDGGRFIIETEQNQGNGAAETFVSRVSFARFLEIAGDMEHMIGKDSNYSLNLLKAYYGRAEVSYEEAAKRYGNLTEKDGITGAFGRLYCDYMGIMLGILPAFVVSGLFLKDKKNQMAELIAVRSAGSWKLIGARYGACIIMMLIPVLVLTLESLLPLADYGRKMQIAVDYLGFCKYIGAWLLPTLLAVSAVSMFLTVLTGTPAAVFVQSAVFFLALQNTASLSGEYSLFTLNIRHNMLGGYELIEENLKIIWYNRLFLVGIAALFVGLTAAVYCRKRRNGERNYVLENKFQTLHRK